MFVNTPAISEDLIANLDPGPFQMGDLGDKISHLEKKPPRIEGASDQIFKSRSADLLQGSVVHRHPYFSLHILGRF